MKTFQIVLYLAFGVGAVAFAWTMWRSNYSAKTGVRSRPSSSPRSPAQSTGQPSAEEVLNLIPALRNTSAQWSNIFQAVNPRQDQRVQKLLLEIRGPHMFDPRTALGVIETGCRSVPKSAPVNQALASAVESMNKVVGFGRWAPDA